METPNPIRLIREARVRHHAAWNALTSLDQRRTKLRHKARARRWGTVGLITVGALAMLVGLPWLVWRGPYLFDGNYLDRSELAKGSAALVTGLRTSLVACVAALGAGIALLYTARTYRLTRRGQITERFTKALERLGSEQQYVRIGGILALEQIVQDAPEQAATDAARVLGHFIRDRAPKAAPSTIPAAEPDESAPASASPVPEGRGLVRCLRLSGWRGLGGSRGALSRRTAPEANTPELPQEPDADVQAALTALTRAESRIHVDPREALDLHGLHLAGAQLHQTDLTNANLREATLTNANLSKATLTNANLSKATLIEAYLAGASLTNADLSEATLTRANLSGTLLGAVDLSDAILTDATLYGAMLYMTILDRATLTGTDLRKANLSSAQGFTQRLADGQTDGETILPPEGQQPGMSWWVVLPS